MVFIFNSHRKRAGVHLGYIANSSQGNRETHWTSNHSLTHTKGQIRSMFLEWGRKPEYLERSPAFTGSEHANSMQKGCQSEIWTQDLLFRTVGTQSCFSIVCYSLNPGLPGIKKRFAYMWKVSKSIKIYIFFFYMPIMKKRFFICGDSKSHLRCFGIWWGRPIATSLWHVTLGGHFGEDLDLAGENMYFPSDLGMLWDPPGRAGRFWWGNF